MYLCPSVMNTSEILADLNEAQRAAVCCVDCPSLIVAGAGSGKTRVLTRKIAYLLGRGVRSEEILALTFTNKAAGEMRSRVEALLEGGAVMGMWMGTFHSVFNRILRKEAGLLGYSEGYTIYQPDDTLALLRQIVKERGLDKKVYKDSKLAGWISRAKNLLLTPELVEENGDLQREMQRQGLAETGSIYTEYRDRCLRANAMDFDDLLLNCYLLFDRWTEVRKDWAGRWKWVLVDEYQDTNLAQHEILLQLCREHGRLCVVGDDAQSIYGFRGARIDNMLGFTQLYRDAKIFRLEENYRSTQNIVGAAGSLISHNRGQIEKHIFSRGSQGEPLVLSILESDRLEGRGVVRRIWRLQNEQDISLDQMAILYRTNTQARIFEEELRLAGIPYTIHNGRSFYEGKDVRDVLALWRFTCNSRDEAAFRRALENTQEGIGAVTISKVLGAAQREEKTIMDVLRRPESADLGKAATTRLGSFLSLVEGWQKALDIDDAYQLGSRILQESGLQRAAYSDHDEEHLALQAIQGELLNALRSFVETRRETGEGTGLNDFLQNVALLSDADSDGRAGGLESEAGVNLMTVHAAKGLEWDVVFVVGLENGLFPGERALNSPREIEEERRLLYVAITRARRRCFLSMAKMRYHHGSLEFTEPSRFLKEIDTKYLRMEGGKRTERANAGMRYEVRDTMAAPRQLQNAGSRRVVSLQPSTPTEPAASSECVGYGGVTWRVGMRLSHLRFGQGTIVRVSGQGDDARIVVRFDDEGEKTLLLKFAKIKPLEG